MIGYKLAAVWLLVFCGSSSRCRWLVSSEIVAFLGHTPALTFLMLVVCPSLNDRNFLFPPCKVRIQPGLQLRVCTKK